MLTACGHGEEEGPDEEIGIDRGADRVGLAPGGDGDPSYGGLSQARRERVDLLPLETQVRRHGGRQLRRLHQLAAEHRKRKQQDGSSAVEASR
jgi:hypothetical protein